MVEAVIFDMDGVLVDSNPTHSQVWVEYLDSVGIDPGGIDSWMAGKRNDEIMRRLLGPAASEDEIFAHGAAKEALYRRRMRPIVEERITPGLGKFLDRIAHLPIGLGTNAEPANVDFLLSCTGLRGRFGAVVDGHQVERPKPAPDIYLKVAGLLGVPARDCVIFEDSPSGIRAAKDAGARVIGVHRSRTLPETELTIRDFHDPALWDWLAALQPPMVSERL